MYTDRNWRQCTRFPGNVWFDGPCSDHNTARSYICQPDVLFWWQCNRKRLRNNIQDYFKRRFAVRFVLRSQPSPPPAASPQPKALKAWQCTQNVRRRGFPRPSCRAYNECPQKLMQRRWCEWGVPTQPLTHSLIVSFIASEWVVESARPTRINDAALTFGDIHCKLYKMVWEIPVAERFGCIVKP